MTKYEQEYFPIISPPPELCGVQITYKRLINWEKKGLRINREVRPAVCCLAWIREFLAKGGKPAVVVPQPFNPVPRKRGRPRKETSLKYTQ